MLVSRAQNYTGPAEGAILHFTCIAKLGGQYVGGQGQYVGGQPLTYDLVMVLEQAVTISSGLSLAMRATMP